MRLKVRYFARFRELTGKESEEIHIPQELPLSQVVAAITHLNPALASEDSMMIAVNERFADSGTIVKDEDQVAIFPRVSGG